MMTLPFDQNMFTQTSLDSGSLTILGTVIHSFQQPGEYRGSVHKGEGKQAVFYITVDKESSVAQVNIDLASLPEYADEAQKECCSEGAENHFTVNPRGYVVFHVSRGSGGFSVHVRLAVEDLKEKVFNSQELGDGDIFSASIIRPGTYSLVNRRAKGEIVVSYPEMGKTAYRPPAPVRVLVTPESFEPARIELKPGQGLVFEVKGSGGRVMIKLLKPDDGPTRKRKTPQRGWSKSVLPKAKA
jgi:hypothetical protein